MTDAKTEQPRDVAAIDLGSNSFHMVVAKVIGQDLHIVSRHKQRVRMASGLDEFNNLDNASITRGLDCLAMFAERLQGFDADNVRIAATHTLRQASNAHVFIERARDILPFPIEIIPGIEEARLIFLGVAHTQPKANRKLVIDIGGGSTELIVGQGFEAELVNSTEMGCVSFNKYFFHDGKLSAKNFALAQLAAEQRLEALAKNYKKSGWEQAIGSSGTIKAIREVVMALGHDDGVITNKRLAEIAEKLICFKTIDSIALPGLPEERRAVFASGIAILCGVFNALHIDKLHFSDGALREGLLYESEERFRHSDIRLRTTENLAKKHRVDLEHAEHVKKTATSLYKQAAEHFGWKKKTSLRTLLEWSALLHEVGLSISYQAFHRHSAYLLQHTNMPGFNQEQQTVLATLVRFQRKALKLHEMPHLTMYKKKQLLPLIAILRLAITLNGQRNEEALSNVRLTIKGDEWHLDYDDADSDLDSNWLQNNKLLHADLTTEKAYWDNAGWQLSFS